MTAISLAREALVLDKERTQGEWRAKYEPPGSHGGGDDWHLVSDGAPGTCLTCINDSAKSEPDARMIAFAVNNLATLATALLAANERAERAEAELASLTSQIGSFVEERLDWDRSTDAALYAIAHDIYSGAWRKATPSGADDNTRAQPAPGSE